MPLARGCDLGRWLVGNTLVTHPAARRQQPYRIDRNRPDAGTWPASGTTEDGFGEAETWGPLHSTTQTQLRGGGGKGLGRLCLLLHSI